VPHTIAQRRERSYKVRDVADVQAAPQPPIEAYIDVDDEEGAAESPGATAAPSVGTPHRAASTEEQVVETPRRTSATEKRPRSSANKVGDLGSHKRARKAPPKPCKPNLRSATK
jgi:hypothetical protein